MATYFGTFINFENFRIQVKISHRLHFIFTMITRRNARKRLISIYYITDLGDCIVLPIPEKSERQVRRERREAAEQVAIPVNVPDEIIQPANENITPVTDNEFGEKFEYLFDDQNFNSVFGTEFNDESFM